MNLLSLKKGDIFSFSEWDSPWRLNGFRFFCDKSNEWVDEYKEGRRINIRLTSVYTGEYNGVFTWRDNDCEVIMTKAFVSNWKSSKGVAYLPYGGYNHNTRFFIHGAVNEINLQPC